MRIIPVLIITPLPKETDQLLRFFTSNKHYQYPSSSNNYNNSKKHPIATTAITTTNHPINNINNINNSSSNNGGASTSNSYHNLHITTTNNHHVSHPNPHHTHQQQQQQHMRRGSTHNNNNNSSNSSGSASHKNGGVASNSSMIRNMTYTPTTPTSPTSITGNNHHSHVSHQHHHNSNNSNSSNNSDCVCYYYKKRGTNSKVSEWHIEDFQPAQQQQQSQSQNKNVNTLEKVLFKVTHTGARHAPSLRQALYKQAIENKSLIVFLFSYTKKVHVNIQLLKGSLSSMNHHHVRTELQHKHDRNVSVVVNGGVATASSVVSAAAASAAIVVAAADDDENENNDRNVDKMMNNKQEKKNKKRVSKSASRKNEERKSSSPLAGHEKEAAMRASMNTIIHYCPSLYKTVEVYMREFAELYYQLEYTDRREAWSDDDLNFWLSTRQQMIVNNINNNMSGGDNHHKNLLVKKSESENDGDGEQEEDEEHDSGVGHASHVANSKRKSVSRKKKKNREDDEEREMLLVPLRKSTSKAQSDVMQQHCNNNISNFTYDHMNNNRNSVETNAPLSPERKLRNVSVKRNAIPVSASSQSPRSNRVSLPTPSSTLLATPLANGSGDKTKKLMSLPLEANKKDKKSVDKDDNNKKGTSSLTSLSLAQFNHANDKSKTENQNHWLHQNTLFLNSGCFMMAAHVDLHEMTKDSMSDCRRQLFNETTYRPLFEDRSCVEFDLNLGINVNELFHRFYTQYQDKDNMKLLLSLKSLKHPEQQPHLWLYSDSLEKSSTTHPVHEHDDLAPSLSLDSKRTSSSKKTIPNLDTPLLDRTYKSTPLEHRHSIENLIDMIQKSVQTDNHQHQKLIDELDHEHHSNRSKLQLNKIFPTKFFGLKKKSKDGSNNKSTRDRLINGATVKGLETNILLIPIPDKFVMNQHHRGDHQDDESSSLKGEDNRATRSDTFFHDRVHFPLPFPYYHQHTQKVRSSVLHKNDLHTVYHHSGITKPRQKYPIIVQTNKHHRPRNNNHQSGADPNPDGNKNNGLNQRENNGNTPRTPGDDNKLVAESEFLENESCWADDPTENDLYGETTDGNSDTTEDDISDDEHNYDSSSSNRHISLVSNSSVQPLLRKGASVHHSGFTTGDSMMESNANSSDLFDPDSLIDNDEFTFTSDMMTEFETVCGSEHSASLLSSELYDIQSSIVRGSDLQTYLGRSTYDFQSSSANDNSSLDVVSM